jgi:hypothetical protein
MISIPQAHHDRWLIQTHPRGFETAGAANAASPPQLHPQLRPELGHPTQMHRLGKQWQTDEPPSSPAVWSIPHVFEGQI